jgi:AraC-like DNA-binding protein
MFLIDLVNAINDALPRLISGSTLCDGEGGVFGHATGHAFLNLSQPGEDGPLDARTNGALARLEATRWGLVGIGPVSHSIARIARDRFGAAIVCPDAVSRPPTVPATDFQCGNLADVLTSPVLCVVLPWIEEILALTRQHKHTPINPDVVLVIWKHSPVVERALAHLDKHYDEPVQLRNLARIAGVSPFHLVRLFSATLGITPHRFQILLRLSRAMTMLRDGTCIAQVAHGVGFADHSHLDRSFRILMGMTPTQYQESMAFDGRAIFS